MTQKTLTIYTDGASRGNPGPAACAWLILDGTNVLEADSSGLGRNTCNYAEYSALITALTSAVKYCTPKETVLNIYSDSQLMIRQLNGTYAINSPKLKPMYATVRQKELAFADVVYHHVSRDNSYISSCDWMCNQALDLLAASQQKDKPQSPSLPRIICNPIGIVHSPFREKKDAPKQGRFSNETSTISIFSPYADGLDGLKAGDDIFILCWFDRSDRDILKVHPHGHDADGHLRGVFSTRAPVRPNPISLTLVKLENISGTTLTVRGLEALDTTPVLDIKPYYHDTDSP